MACTYCGGRYKWVATEKLNTNIDPAPIVRAFMCRDCGRFTFWDQARKYARGYFSKRSRQETRQEIPKRQIRQVEQTQNEKIFYAILGKWSMTPREIRKYIQDVEAGKIEKDGKKISDMTTDLQDYDKTQTKADKDAENANRD